MPSFSALISVLMSQEHEGNFTPPLQYDFVFEVGAENKYAITFIKTYPSNIKSQSKFHKNLRLPNLVTVL